MNEAFNFSSSKFAPHKSYLISPEGLTWQELLKLHPAELF